MRDTRLQEARAELASRDARLAELELRRDTAPWRAGVGRADASCQADAPCADCAARAAAGDGRSPADDGGKASALALQLSSPMLYGPRRVLLGHDYIGHNYVGPTRTIRP